MALFRLKKRKLDMTSSEEEGPGRGSHRLPSPLSNNHNCVAVEEDADLLHVVTPRQNQKLRMSQIMTVSKEARLICKSTAPYQVVFANKPWTTMTSYASHEMCGKSISKALSRNPEEVSDGNIAVIKMLQEAKNRSFSSLHGFCSTTKNNEEFKCSLVIRPIYSIDMYGFEVLSHFLVCMFDYISKRNVDSTVASIETAHPSVNQQLPRNSSFGELSDVTERENESQHFSTESSGKAVTSRSNSFHEDDQKHDSRQRSINVKDSEKESIALTLLALKNHNDSIESKLGLKLGQFL